MNGPKLGAGSESGVQTLPDRLKMKSYKIFKVVFTETSCRETAIHYRILPIRRC